jgi:hypothetical protein
MSRSSVNPNSTPRGWLWIVLLALTLAACTPEFIPAPTMIPFPTATSTHTLSTFTPMATVEYSPPTTIPTLVPPPIFTPDAIQVERWQEYQTELAKALLYGYGPEAYKGALCEWDILGRSGQDVYVWAYCATLGGGSGGFPAVISLEADGSIQKVGIPTLSNSTWDSQIQRMFPVDVQEKIYSYYSPHVPYTGRPEVLRIHLHYRREHSEEPPVAVLSAPPAP